MRLLRKLLRYIPFLLCLFLCVALPFLMLAVEQKLTLQLLAAGDAPVTVHLREDGELITEHRATLSLQQDVAVITTASGETLTVRANELVRSTSPAGILSRGTLYAVAATIVVGLLMVVLLIPLNAYLIQFSIEHTPDRRFSPFEAA